MVLLAMVKKMATFILSQLTCRVYLIAKGPGRTTRDTYTVSFIFFRALQTIQMTFLRMRDKYQIINMQRNEKQLWNTYHGLFIRTHKIF